MANSVNNYLFKMKKEGKIIMNKIMFRKNLK